MRINTNIQALNAQRNLAANGMALTKSVERLSSGLRINRAGDDAAGLSISEKLRSQVRGLNQAVRNAQDGISLIQTAEGALTEVHSILQRMRELVIQAANDTLTTSDRTSISQELQALRDEIDRIAGSTQFNTKTLLTGSLNTTLGAASSLLNGEILGTANVVVARVNVSGAPPNTVFNITGNSGAGTLTLTNATTGVAQTVTVSAMTATAASSQTLNFATLGVSLQLAGFDAAGTAANIVTDLVGQTSITTDPSGGSASFHIGANQSQTMTVSITDMRSTAIGTSAVVGYTTLSAAVDQFVIDLNQAGANNLILNVDNAIADVSANRGRMGAFQNRLEHTIANLSVASENLAASESRIRDADMAEEMVGFTKRQILNQAGTAILAQANQMPQAILSLLQG